MKLRKYVLAGASTTVVLVAGASRATAPAGRYMISSGTVYDTKTKLTWQQTAPAGTYAWGAGTAAGTAGYYCANLSLSGGGWRLPTMKELLTLIDYSMPASGSVAMIDSTAFPNTPSEGFWSATPVASGTGAEWGVGFGDSGTHTYDVAASDLYVRCVR